MKINASTCNNTVIDIEGDIRLELPVPPHSLTYVQLDWDAQCLQVETLMKKFRLSWSDKDTGANDN